MSTIMNIYVKNTQKYHYGSGTGIETMIKN